MTPPPSQRNNFDLLRFAFALIVFLVHSHVLSGQTALSGLSRHLSSEFAVRAFFVVSGYLVVMSFENSATGRSYFEKRARRIYPAYFTVVMACALLGYLMTDLGAREYFSSVWLRYVVANLVFLNFLAPSLPGVFTGNSLQAVNGALWTLKLEVTFYLAVPFIIFFGRRFGHAFVLPVIYLASVAYAMAMQTAFESTQRTLYDVLGRQLPGQLSFFMAGTLLFYYRAEFRRMAPWLVPAALVVLVVGERWSSALFGPFALGVVVIWAATLIPYLGNFGKYGDLSYGLYIIHFPVLQTLIACGLFETRPWLALLLAGAIVVALAFASWHLVEKPFLARGSHYLAAARGAEPE